MRSGIKTALLILVIAMLIVVPVSAGWLGDTFNWVTGKMTGQAVAPLTFNLQQAAPANSGLQILSDSSQPSSDTASTSDDVETQLSLIDSLIDALEKRICALEKKAGIGLCSGQTGIDVEVLGQEELTTSGQENVGLFGSIFGAKDSTTLGTITPSGAAVATSGWQVAQLPFTDVAQREDAVTLTEIDGNLVYVYLTKTNTVKMTSCQSNCEKASNWKVAQEIPAIAESDSGVAMMQVPTSKAVVLAYVGKGDNRPINVVRCAENCLDMNSWKTQVVQQAQVGMMGDHTPADIKPELEVLQQNLFLFYNAKDNGRTIYARFGEITTSLTSTFQLDFSINKDGTPIKNTLTGIVNIGKNTIAMVTNEHIKIATLKNVEQFSTVNTNYRNLVGGQGFDPLGGNAIELHKGNLYVPIIYKSGSTNKVVVDVEVCDPTLNNANCYITTNGKTELIWDTIGNQLITNMDPENYYPKKFALDLKSFSSERYLYLTYQDEVGKVYIAKYLPPNFDWSVKTKLEDGVGRTSEPVMTEHNGKMYLAYQSDLSTGGSILLRTCEKDCTSLDNWSPSKTIITDIYETVVKGSVSMASHKGALIISYISDNDVYMTACTSRDCMTGQWQASEIITGQADGTKLRVPDDVKKTLLVSEGGDDGYLYLMYPVKYSNTNGLYSLRCETNCYISSSWGKNKEIHRITTRDFIDVDAVMYDDSLWIAGLQKADNEVVVWKCPDPKGGCWDGGSGEFKSIGMKVATDIPQTVSIESAFGKLFVLSKTATTKSTLLQCSGDQCYNGDDTKLAWRNTGTPLTDNFPGISGDLQTFSKDGKLYAAYVASQSGFTTQINDMLKVSAYYDAGPGLDLTL